MNNPDIFKKIMEDRQRAIDNFQYAVQHVFGDKKTPPFTYTIGMTESFKHPELIIIGLNPHVAHGIMNRAGAMIRDGQRFGDMSRVNTIVENYPVVFRNVPSPTKEEWARGSAARYPSGFALLQMFYPDIHGLFPWDEGAEKDFHRIQDFLYLPPVQTTD